MFCSYQADISNPRVAENTYFQNLFETEVDDERMNHSPVVPGIIDEPSKAAYLYWNDNAGTGATEKSIGPAITLRVGVGDEISIDAFARYEEKTSYARNVTATMLASLLGHSFIGQNGLDNVSNLNGMFQDGIGSAGFFNTGTDNTKPYAFLNYIFFDSEFNFVDAGSKRVDDDGEFEPGDEAVNITFDHLSFDSAIVAEEAGYIYIWVSNESKNTKVWFDDLKVVHRGSVVTQSTDYDPWGLVMRDSKTDDEFLYRYGYQGAFAEHDEETGWSHFELREFDPVVGRWMRTDPYGQYFSPYVGMGNDPLNGIDPDGGFFDDIFASTTNRETTVVKTSDKFDRLFVDGEYQGKFKQGFWKDIFADAKVFENYGRFFSETYGSDLGNKEFFAHLYNRTWSEDQRKGLFQAVVTEKDPRALLPLAIPVAAIAGGELLAAAPVISGAVEQLSWNAYALKGYGDVVFTNLARRYSYSLATKMKPLLLAPAYGTVAWKLGVTTFREMIHFGLHGKVDVAKTAKTIYNVTKTVKKFVD